VLKYKNEKKRAQKLLAGDDSDSKQFFDEFFPRLYRFAINRMSGDHEATREVVQGTLTKILLNLDKFRGDSALFTWMCSICNNEILDFQHRQSRYRHAIVLETNLNEHERVEKVASQSAADQPEDVYGRDQKALKIHQVLDNLPFQYGTLLEWKYIEGLSVKEMADRLGQSPAATQSTLFRARMAFQELYAETVVGGS
jgi:RNA polymerase sigma-70 factor (ECF subfamily)